MRRRKSFRSSLGLLLLLIGVQAMADDIRVAVASNFATTMETLAHRFEQASGHHVIVIPGASGRLYAQILHGAPFDAFFSADSERPEKLENSGHAIESSRFTYAIGRLVLWSRDGSLIGSDGRATLKEGRFERLAIANPRLAPYGRAAAQVLENIGFTAGNRIVRGENVGQAYQFVHSGAAELGLVSASQLVSGEKGSRWDIPQQLYDPIEQQAILLNDSSAARAFFDWLQTGAARDIIRQHGYGTP